MFLKKCPFCNHEVSEQYDPQTKNYKIQCRNCKDIGLDVKIIGKDCVAIQKIWNTRKFEDLLLDNPKEIITAIEKEKSGDLTKLGTKRITTEYLVKEEFGYLILPSGELIKCFDSHPEEILNVVGIDSKNIDLSNFDYENFCIKHGIIRICMQLNNVMIVLPKKMLKKEQMDILLKVLTNEITNVKKYHVYQIKNDIETVMSFDTLQSLYLYLDEVH